MFNIAEMLISAARNDSAVASALVDSGESKCGSLVLNIQARAVAIALDADEDESRQ